MGRWLSKIQKSTSQPPYKTYERPSVGSVGTPLGAFDENQTSDPSASVGSVGRPPGAFDENQAPGPLSDIDTIISVLVKQVGRDLGPELVRRARHVMAPMSRKDRAELAAALDDAFEVAPSVGAARWQCHRLLSDNKALAEAKAAWPGLPLPMEDETHG
ncbi:MAG: hypothetical protein ACTH3D_12615 [Halomonas sp.]|uniref:hypothetical protein n=1 Tax=Halomonas sp. TaxID=1486246 RepID=UPI003F91CC54